MKFGRRTDFWALLALAGMIGWSICYAQFHVAQVAGKLHVLEFANASWANYTNDIEKVCGVR